MLKEVTLYTDGACSGNPGPGGYACILTYHGKEKVVSGGEHDTTNNRMELMGVISGLEQLKVDCRVTVVTDSKYVCDSVMNKWVYAWRVKGWRKSDGSPALNVDLWEKLLNLMERHVVTFEWIKGHNGHPYNERCDAIAVEETEKHK